MPKLHFKQLCFHAWIWVGILTTIIWLYPVSFKITRLLSLVGISIFWVGALIRWWPKKTVRPALFLPLAGVGLLLLPSRPIQTDALARNYCTSLRLYRNVHYIWGGESFLGVDCYGLVRQGLILGQLRHGICTLNGRPIRDALGLWWNDCSALALRDGSAGVTHKLFEANSIAYTDHTRLRPGDLAVTADGVHVMAYLGDQNWIEADPGAKKVLELNLQSSNAWLHAPVVFVRWSGLQN